MIVLKGIILVSGVAVAFLVGTSETNAHGYGWIGTGSSGVRVLSNGMQIRLAWPQ